MTNFKRDGNFVPVTGGVLTTDGVTPAPIEVTPDGDLKIIDSSLPTTGNNPSLVLSYTGDNLTTVTKTINSIQYQKTLSYTGSVLDSVSEWSLV